MKIFGIALMVMLVGCGGGDDMSICEQVNDLEWEWRAEFCYQKDEDSCLCKCWSDGLEVSDYYPCSCEMPGLVECNEENMKAADLCLAHEETCWQEFSVWATGQRQLETCIVADAIFRAGLIKHCWDYPACPFCRCISIDKVLDEPSGQCVEPTPRETCEGYDLENAEACLEHRQECEQAGKIEVQYYCEQ